MRIIGWMLSRMILVRFIFILFGISIFVITLDIVAYLSVILALLLTLVELSYRNEIPAIWSTGISPLRLMAMLLPFALLVGGIHFLLYDQGVPNAAPTL